MKNFGQSTFEPFHAYPVLWLLPYLLVCFPLSVSAQNEIDEITTLIAQLGDEDFQVRENAETRLFELGSDAIDQVDSARRSPNSEIRFRARRLAALLKKTEFEKSIDKFINDDPTHEATPLPGWKEFSDIVGTSNRARKFFAVIYKASPDLIESFNEDPNLTRDQYRRLHKTMTRAGFRSLNAATILFLDASEIRPASEDNQSDQLRQPRYRTTVDELLRTSNYVSNSNMVTFVAASGYEDLFKKLIDNWLEKFPDEPSLKAARMKLIEAHELVERLPYVIETAMNDQETPQARAKAIRVAAKLGTQADIESLVPLLENTESVGHFSGKSENSRLNVLLQDVALAACLKLCDADLSEYGFDTVEEKFIPLSKTGFITPLDRERAFEKWQRFYQENIRSD